MLDPKFMNLPFLVSCYSVQNTAKYTHFTKNQIQAQDQKDVYETEDTQSANVPEYYEEEAENESIDRGKLNPTDAYSHFKNKYLIGNVDFSDNIAKKRNSGYNAV